MRFNNITGYLEKGKYKSFIGRMFDFSKHYRKKKAFKDIFLIKPHSYKQWVYGIVKTGNNSNIYFPKEFIGKRVKLKVEFIKNKWWLK